MSDEVRENEESIEVPYQKFVGVRSLNYLVGRIKYENNLQNVEIDDKLDKGDGIGMTEVDLIWGLPIDSE